MDQADIKGILRSAVKRGAVAGVNAALDALLTAVDRATEVPMVVPQVEAFADEGFDATVKAVMKVKETGLLLPLVILESPFAGDVEANVAYARRAMRDCLLRLEAPIASHLLYNQSLNDNVPEERALGITAGLAWRRVASGAVFYIDKGISDGMAAAMSVYLTERFPFSVRSIFADSLELTRAQRQVLQLSVDFDVVEGIAIHGDPQGFSFEVSYPSGLAPEGS